MHDWRTSLRGGLIYASGDSIATLILGEFQFERGLGIFIVGATLYAAEIPRYFRWLDTHFDRHSQWNSINKAVLAQAFFNPIWIARHLLFIRLFSRRWTGIDWQLLRIGVDSFLSILPIGLLMNYLIQNRVPLNWRFLASALYSALMAIYVALSEVLFG